MAQSSVAHTGATMPFRYENGSIESKRARGAWPTELKWSETMSRDRSLVSYGLSHLKALELRMLQIERSSRIIACTRMRSAKLLRFGPRLEGGATGAAASGKRAASLFAGCEKGHPYDIRI